MRRLGDRVREGLVIAPAARRSGVIRARRPCAVITRCRRRAASRPVVGALALARRAMTPASLLVLLSGGASALMAVPAEGITLDDKRAHD